MLKVRRNGSGNCETEGGRREANLRPVDRARRGAALTFRPEIIDAGCGTPGNFASFCTLRLFALKKNRAAPLSRDPSKKRMERKKNGNFYLFTLTREATPARTVLILAKFF